MTSGGVLLIYTQYHGDYFMFSHVSTKLNPHLRSNSVQTDEKWLVNHLSQLRVFCISIDSHFNRFRKYHTCSYLLLRIVQNMAIFHSYAAADLIV